MDIFLVRHTESIKNVRNSFSSVGDTEPLTEKGVLQASQLVEALVLLVDKLKLKPQFIYSADSSRSVSVAKMLAMGLGNSVHAYEDLRSIQTSLSGVTESEASKIDAEFMHHYHLYRSGLMNAYHIKRREDYEHLHEFETRVSRSIREILSDPSETAKIIILHRSPITATLIDISRKCINYPKDFYGHVPLDLGSLSWIRRIPNGEWKILRVNVKIQEIMYESGYLIGRK